jgi:hypothetical protein
MENELTVMEQKAESEMAPIMQRAQAFMVTDEATYAGADAIIVEVKARVKDREAELLPPKDAATKAWKAMCALVKKYIDDPLEACKTLDRKRYAWKQAEDRKRAAEAERLRQVELKRQAEERMALAIRLEESNMKEQAAAVLDAPVAPVEVAAPVKVDKPEGQSYVENWQATVVDASLVPRDFLIPDLVAIGKYAKLMKGKASMPGVTFEDVGSVRRRA